MTDKKLIAFDLEIAKEIPEGCEDWRTIRPLGISCAAISFAAKYSEDSNPLQKLLFYHGNDNFPLSGAMTQFEVGMMIDAIHNLFHDNGYRFYRFLTWNGLSFDFDVLAEESGRYELCKELALDSIDMMFQIVCLRGYPVGMDKVAHGLGLHGKTEGMHGDLAPKMWDGTLEERVKVLEYVGQDAITTYEIYEAALKSGGVRWTSNSGKPMFVPIRKWLTVRECLELPTPDTSWMTNPRKREQYMEWIMNEKH